MPLLSRWFLGAALTFLLVGAGAGAALMLGRAGVLPPVPWLLAFHIEPMLAGWAVQLALGIGYWILPRHKTGAPRGNEALTWGVFVVFNAGVLLAAISGAVGDWRYPAILGHAAEAAAVFTYAAAAWRRLPRSIVPTGRSLPIA